MPLSQLAQAARAFAAHNWDQRVTVGGTEEVAEVSFAFNDMADSLQQAETLRRNLMADVAHELRTPLTVLQGNLRAMLDGVYPLERGEIATLYDETRLLNRLVDDLRELALAEAGQLKLNLQPIDLAALIGSTVTNFMPVAEERGLTLKREDRSGRLRFTPIPIGWRRCCGISSPMRCGTRHRRARSPSRRKLIDRMVRVTVTDTGEGIAPEDMPHVFDRFYRADQVTHAAHGRQRPGPGDCEVAHRSDGRTDRRRQRIGQGQSLLVHPAAGRWVERECRGGINELTCTGGSCCERRRIAPLYYLMVYS